MNTKEFKKLESELMFVHNLKIELDKKYMGVTGKHFGGVESVDKDYKFEIVEVTDE